MTERGTGSNQYGDKSPTRGSVLARAEEARRAEALRRSVVPPAPEPDVTLEAASRLLSTLDDHGVEYVLVGGFAVRLHAPEEFSTKDVDVQARRTRENLAALAEALDELRAVYRVAGDDREDGAVPFVPWSVERLVPFTGERGNLTLRTSHGPLDVGFGLYGFPRGYDDLILGASPRRLGDRDVPTASLGDVIESKSTHSREKDAEALPRIIALATRLRGR